MLRSTVVFLMLTLVSLSLTAQELNCSCVINDQRVQSQEKRIFRDMEQAFAQFLNDRKWTEMKYNQDEKIKCNLAITIDANPSITTYKASVQITSARPVYGSNYETIVFNFADRDFEFEYTESQPMNFNDQIYTNNITSMLAFYAYIIIGMDMDSFGSGAGTPYFNLARDVVINAQQSGRSGWTQFDSNRNRYWLQENLLNNNLELVRESMYDYHRLGLDTFYEDPVAGREVIVGAIAKIQEAKNINRNPILIISFFDAKSDEIVKIFQEGDLAQRKKIYDMLVDIQPGKTSRYETIIKN